MNLNEMAFEIPISPLHFINAEKLQGKFQIVLESIHLPCHRALVLQVANI